MIFGALAMAVSMGVVAELKWNASGLDTATGFVITFCGWSPAAVEDVAGKGVLKTFSLLFESIWSIFLVIVCVPRTTPS